MNKKFHMTPAKLTAALFAVILLTVPIVTIALPKQERSENENRTLAKFPDIVNHTKMDKAENLGDVLGAIRWDDITTRDEDSWMDKFETYFSDHLVGREDWVRARNEMEKLAGKKEINGVYTVDDQMIQAFKTYDKSDVESSLNAMNRFAETHPDIQVSFMMAPTVQELYTSKIPSYAGYLSEKTFIDECYKKMNGISTVDCLSYLTGHSSEYVFYRTDHHWTSLGAYYACCAAAKTLGYSAYTLDQFNIETASSSFRGTLYSKTLDNGVTPDSIDYFHLASGGPKVKMTVFDGTKETVYDSLYVRSYLDVKDKYSSFTGSNSPIVTIETDVDNGKNLLLIKDSYAHSLVPFLANHYSKITMVDMRYINVDLGRLIDLSEYQQALFMYNAVTFSSDLTIKRISLTK